MILLDLLFYAFVCYWIFDLGRDIAKGYKREKQRRLEKKRLDLWISWAGETKTNWEIFSEFYKTGIFTFGEIIDAFPRNKRPTPVGLGPLAKDLGIDFSDQDQRTNNNLTPKEDAILYLAAGVNTPDIAAYLLEDWDDLQTTMKAFLDAGFSKRDTLNAFFEAATDSFAFSYGAVVGEALELGIFYKDIADELADFEIDPEDLDAEMDDAGIFIRDRVRILNSLFEELEKQQTELRRIKVRAK